MIIEDVPIESVRNLNPNLRDNDRSSLTYLSFSLVGLMQETVLEVTPAFFNFSEILSINTLYKYINILKGTPFKSRTSPRPTPTSASVLKGSPTRTSNTNSA